MNVRKVEYLQRDFHHLTTNLHKVKCSSRKRDPLLIADGSECE